LKKSLYVLNDCCAIEKLHVVYVNYNKFYGVCCSPTK
jgi:hypothetical protein